MALARSTMLPLGTRLPDFSLKDPAGRVVSGDDLGNTKALVVAFICNHCPYVKHLKLALAAFADEYAPRGLQVVAINSNDIAAYPDDAPDMMARDIETFGYSFPYLLDETQAIAKAFRAVCTPEFYLFDENRKLVYRGRFDEARPGMDTPVTGADLRAAADAVLAGTPCTDLQNPSMGCNIKWRPGNEPDYWG